MLLDAVQLMLFNIRSEPQNNWTLHMHTAVSMLPYFFVTNRTNYSRWIPVYLLEISQIPLDIQIALKDGEFSFTEIPGKTVPPRTAASFYSAKLCIHSIKYRCGLAPPLIPLVRVELGNWPPPLGLGSWSGSGPGLATVYINMAIR